METKNLYILALTLLTFTLTACPEKHDDTSDSPAEKVIFVKGDPNQIIAGTKGNTASPFTADNGLELNNFTLLDMSQFVERQAVIKHDKSEQEITAGATQTDETKTDASLHAVHAAKNDAGAVELSMLRGKMTLVFTSDANGQLQPTSARAGNETVALQIIHWSVSKDGNYMSLLVSTADADEGRALVAFNFEKINPAPLVIPTTDEKYIYASGAGKKIAWKSVPGQPIQVQYCGPNRYWSKVKEQMSKWTDAMSGRLAVNLSAPATCAPFNDLNEHSIFVVDTYFTEASPSNMNYGSTYISRSLSRVEVFDADIFIFNEELHKWDKAVADQGYGPNVAAAVIDKKLDITFLHELGHFWGLGHKFDGTLSIMSYDLSEATLWSYDKAAIQELYPAIPGLQGDKPAVAAKHWWE